MVHPPASNTAFCWLDHELMYCERGPDPTQPVRRSAMADTPNGERARPPAQSFFVQHQIDRTEPRHALPKCVQLIITVSTDFKLSTKLKPSTSSTRHHTMRTRTHPTATPTLNQLTHVPTAVRRSFLYKKYDAKKGRTVSVCIKTRWIKVDGVLRRITAGINKQK
jgi:hypothetical protein